jgi:activator of HSP90 ATPase
MPYTFTLTATIPASAQRIYDTWLDSAGHSEMTGGKASMSKEIGADVSAWDGYITGRNLELAPGKRIVQSWRTTNFSDDHKDSTVEVSFEKVEKGTLLRLVHADVPDGQTSYEQGGWQEHYFLPMQKYFATS